MFKPFSPVLFRYRYYPKHRRMSSLCCTFHHSDQRLPAHGKISKARTEISESTFLSFLLKYSALASHDHLSFSPEKIIWFKIEKLKPPSQLLFSHYIFWIIIYATAISTVISPLLLIFIMFWKRFNIHKILGFCWRESGTRANDSVFLNQLECPSSYFCKNCQALKLVL